MEDFKKSTVYQIYPKSFADSRGNGTGDLKGVISKLDYLKELGIDYIWMTPFFLSPQKDNGYDVADYYRIDPSYGTMEDFDELVKEAAKREISLMLDMVFNHTSSRHEWFQKALAGDEKYKNYYIFKRGKGPGIPPTNWESKFGGNAWEYVEALDEYYLHLFDISQPDLNWDNEEVRKEMQKVILFWMGKGVKGFRFDVVNLISKEAFEDDYEGDGRKFYTDGPNIHKYLRELNEKTFGKENGILTVGEMSSTSMENCYQYAGEDGKEFSMVFSFHHLKVDFMGNEKWVLVPYDFAKLKQILFDWQTNMAKNHAWNAVFWCNHDQPRVVSRFGDTGKYWKESAKMLATVIHCLRGTPYIYQGEELGMTNAEFQDISKYRDVESLNHFQILQEKGLNETQAYQILQVHSRDNSRTPMQWSEEDQAGFTKGKPWIEVNENYKKINASQQLKDPDSIFHYYKKLVSLRKEYDVIAYGDFEALDVKNPSVMAYRRTYKGETLVAASNFYGKEAVWNPETDLKDHQYLLGNYSGPLPEKVTVLRPYETRLYYKGRIVAIN
ncbi:alpha,alpha-phosphotrehalase [uncultured Robinsoniella sp.]|uniref:alpha,alpha-phosphotrehalase n=1 Tax=uncultured Robinsoniella sp. TaxID=904190 RepID=UPI00374FCACE